MDFTKGEILEEKLRLIAFAFLRGPANRGLLCLRLADSR